MNKKRQSLYFFLSSSIFFPCYTKKRYFEFLIYFHFVSFSFPLEMFVFEDLSIWVQIQCFLGDKIIEEKIFIQKWKFRVRSWSVTIKESFCLFTVTTIPPPISTQTNYPSNRCDNFQTYLEKKKNCVCLCFLGITL